jgi:hypothetical protein
LYSSLHVELTDKKRGGGMYARLAFALLIAGTVAVGPLSLAHADPSFNEPQDGGPAEPQVPVTPMPVAFELSNPGAVPREGRADYPFLRTWLRTHTDYSHFRDLLARAQGNLSRAARWAGLSRVSLYEKMKKLNIRSQDEEV